MKKKSGKSKSMWLLHVRQPGFSCIEQHIFFPINARIPLPRLENPSSCLHKHSNLQSTRYPKYEIGGGGLLEAQPNWTFNLGWLLSTFSARTDCTKTHTNSPNLHENYGEHSRDYSLNARNKPKSPKFNISKRERGLSIRDVTTMCSRVFCSH